MSSLLPAPRDPGHSCQQCAPFNLDALFLELNPRLAFSAGPVTQFIGSSCPLARVICLALDLHCGPAWATLSQQQSTSSTASAAPGPDLILKPGFWVRTSDNVHGYLEPDYPRLIPRLMMALDSQPSWAWPVTYEGKPLRDEVDRPPYPYIFGELEVIPEPHTAPSDSSRSTENHAPRRRSIKPTVDARLVRTWLDSCKHSAASHCTSSETLWDGKGLRLIDVQRGCLTHVTERHEYLALSYPWGETGRSSLCATTSNIDVLSQAGSLDIDDVKEHQGKTPSRTVLDAMHLARDIGFRYLWVDALCILQDDAEERRRLIHGMGGIYETATCTIICAAGTNADSGLKGVWNTTRQRLIYDEPVRLSGRQLGTYSVMMSRPSLDSEVKRSHWNTRGWTYQEMCLSSRLLYFTAGEVFFTCYFCHKREGYDLSHGSPNNPSEIVATTSPRWKTDPVELQSLLGPSYPVHFRSLPSERRFINFHVYITVVQEYTKRDLTLGSDVINAFQGIFNRFIDPGKTYLTLVNEAQCIPPQFLPLALLWYPISGSARRCSSLQSTAPSRFSSWSWTSWHGPVTFLAANAAHAPHTGLINMLACELPEELGSLIQASGLPRPLLPSWDLTLSKKAAAAMLLSPGTRQSSDEMLQSPESPRPRGGIGVLELWVPALLGSAVRFWRLWLRGWHTLSKKAAAAVLLSPDTRQFSDGLFQRPESPRPRGGIGVLELWVPVLLGSAVRFWRLWGRGWHRFSLCDEYEEQFMKGDDGWFRFDQDPGPAPHLLSFLAVAVSVYGTVGVVGVVENDGDDKTVRRVGVGWINIYGLFDRRFNSAQSISMFTLQRVLLR